MIVKYYLRYSYCICIPVRTDVILFVLNAETGEVQPPQETIR